ncbi:mucin-15 [Struthio camelus]|uniref:mucin-15 n=1 Tax=Struthio camelus TaxID=8801 RepID=UPI003603B16F
MERSCGMVLFFLLARLQWTTNNIEGTRVNEIKNENSSVTGNNQSIVQVTSRSSAPPMTTAINLSAVRHAAPTTANESVMKRADINSQTKSTPLRSTDGTALMSNVTMISKDGTNNNRIPTTSATSATNSDFSTGLRSAAAIPTYMPSTTIPSNISHSTHSAATLSRDSSSTNPAASPAGSPQTSFSTKHDSPATDFNPIQQTAEMNHHFTNTSNTSSNPKDTNAEKTMKGGVIFGVILGAILGFVLFGLMGYFICGKKSSEPFSHRRLYDDTRSEPALQLDNSLGPYDVSIGAMCYDKTSAADKAEKDNAGCLSEGIAMDDITPPHPSE